MDSQVRETAVRMIHMLCTLASDASTQKTRIAIQNLWLDDALMKEAFAILDSEPGRFFNQSQWHFKIRRLRNDVDEFNLLMGEDLPEEQGGSISMAVSWADFGNLYRRLAENCEVAAIKDAISREQLAKAMASADALCAIQETLSEAQARIVAITLESSLRQQGY